MKKTSKSVVIVGGGLAGIAVASRLKRRFNVTVIEPSETHLYQPGLTLLGTGLMNEPQYLKTMTRSEERVMPRKVRWIKDAAVAINPEENQVVLGQGQIVEYDYLVVATGIDLRWDSIPGIDAVFDENSSVVSVCSLHTAALMNRKVQDMPRGRLIVSTPATPIKCGGVPKKVAFVLHDRAQEQGVDLKVSFAWPGTIMNDVPKFEEILDDVAASYGIEQLPERTLVRVDDSQKVATFQTADGQLVEEPYDLLHVVPPMTAPALIRQAGLATDQGFLDVDHTTLQHNQYLNVFGLGDSAGVPTARTGAAVRKQAPVLARNLKAFEAGQDLRGEYDGYSCCPVLTRKGRVVLMEFRYGNIPCPTVPWNSIKESWMSWFLKRRLLGPLYWNGMLTGLM